VVDAGTDIMQAARGMSAENASVFLGIVNLCLKEKSEQDQLSFLELAEKVVLELQPNYALALLEIERLQIQGQNQ